MNLTLLKRWTSKIENSKKALAITIATFCAIIMFILHTLGILDTLELKSLDYRFRHANNPQLTDTNIVMVAIDDASLEYYEKNLVSWPWPREFYGMMLDYFKRANAKAVGFDMIFTQKDISGSDQVFAEAIKNFGSTVIALRLSDESNIKYNELNPEKEIAMGNTGLPVTEYRRPISPLPEFQDGAKYLGVVDLPEDKDGVARRTPLLYKYRENYFYNFALAMYASGTNKTPSEILSILKKHRYSNDDKYYYYWYGKGGVDRGVFKYYNAQQIISSEIALMTNQKPFVDLKQFKNKYIIIGGSSAGLFDFKSTPFSYLEPYPGMEIHATMLSNLLNGHYIKVYPEWTVYIAILAFSFLTAFVYFSSRKATMSIFVILSIGLVYLGLSLLLFKFFIVWIPLISVEITVFLTFTFSAYASYLTEGKQRRFLRTAMGRYLNPQVVDIIVKNPNNLELGGDEYEASVFFSDIKDFTTISEGYPPKELIKYLNEYLTLSTDIILQNKAMLDKFIGDAIMAIFGAPLRNENHAYVACKTALELQDMLTNFYANPPSENYPVFTTRIGINTGKFIIGNVGSKNRLEYTAIGDTVNLASRLEGVNKEFGTSIIINETTYEQAKGHIIARELDLIRVKGKTIPVKIYELLADLNNIHPNKDFQYVEVFHEALKHYRNQDWSQAIDSFNRVLSLKANDEPSKVYMNRIVNIMNSDIPQDWTGIYDLKTK